MATTVPAVHGRINDLDSHLQVPISRWGEVFGDATARFGERFAGIALFDATDEPELTAESVWNTKGTAAPGASTPEGRLAAMDVMGIERQLIFPQVVLAMPAWSDHPNAGAVLREYNDAVLRWTAAGDGRLRPTALLNLTTIEGAIAEAERVAAGGARAVFIQDGIAPGGRSPAAPEVDPLWALLAEADLPVTLHIGGQEGFFGSDAWPDADLLRPGSFSTGEPVGPHMLATMHLAAQNYLAAMIYGGVFDRHPEPARRRDRARRHVGRPVRRPPRGPPPVVPPPARRTAAPPDRGLRRPDPRHAVLLGAHRPPNRALRHARDLRVLHRLPPPRRRHRSDRPHGRRHRAPRRRSPRSVLRPQRRTPAPRLSTTNPVPTDHHRKAATMPDARPDSPELSDPFRDELLLSLRRWTVDGSVPLTHEFLRTGDGHARESYCRIQAENPVAQLLLEERYLAPLPDMDALRAMGDGTLGRAFAAHIDDNGLDVTKLRESAFIDAHARDGDDQAYLAERGFQLHDLFHVLTGYDTSPLGEVGVVSFTAAQTMSPYPTFIMTTRPLQMAMYEPDLLPFVMDTVAEGWTRGRKADLLIGIRWEDCWTESLDDLRGRHSLVTG